MKHTTLLLCSLVMLSACSPIKTSISNQYTLDSFGAKKWHRIKTHTSILVSLPESMAGLQTEQMHYIQKPFELGTFVHSAWISSPATLIYPLITQSLQKTGYFQAVASGPYSDKADYRLDTQVIALQQNFLVKPSQMELMVRVMLTHISDNQVIASEIMGERVTCLTDTPYGGVVAANKATRALTTRLSQFVIREINKNSIAKN